MKYQNVAQSELDQCKTGAYLFEINLLGVETKFA